MTAALSFGLVLCILGYLVIQWRARSRWDEPIAPVVVKPAAFDVTAARAELVSDDLLAVALGAGVVVSQQREPGAWS